MPNTRSSSLSVLSPAALEKRAARIAERKVVRKASRKAAILASKAEKLDKPAVLAGPKDTISGAKISNAVLADHVKHCRQLVTDENWQAIVQMTDDEKIILGKPRLLAFRLDAAVALREQAVFGSVARLAAKLSDDSPVKMGILRDLAKADQGHLAAEILLAAPELRAKPAFLRTARYVEQSLLRRKVKEERKLRLKFNRAVIEASGGGVLIDHTPSTFAFAPRPAGLPVVGSIALAAGPRVPAHHLPKLQQDAKNFRRLVEKSATSGSSPTLHEYHNVFTDRNGQIWTEDRKIIRSKGLRIGISDRTAVPVVPVAFLLHKKTKGIYHWIVDRVPQISWIAEPKNDIGDLRILISDAAPGFERACMDMIGLSDRVQTVGDALFVERLIIPDVGFTNMAGWSHVDWGLRKLIEFSMKKAVEERVDLPARIYISRRDASRRPLVNEPEVEAAASERGFTLYRFADLPIWHQIAIVYSAKIVLAPHGAGLSHLIMAQSGTKVVEIMPIRDGTHQLRFNYARLSMIRGLDYSAWIEAQHGLTDAWTLDMAPFLGFLDPIMSEYEERHPKGK